MRQQLIRSTVLAVALAILIIGAPVFAATWWLTARDASTLRDWVDNGASASTSLLLMGSSWRSRCSRSRPGCSWRPGRPGGCPDP